MMKTIKGPGIFLAQFAGDQAPFNTLEGMAGWAAGLGYEGIQIPSWDGRLFDLKRAAESKAYCDEILGMAARAGLAITELSTHLQGQLVASHPAYDTLLDGFCAGRIGGQREGPPGVGRAAVGVGGEGEPQPWPERARNVFGRAGVAVLLSLAAAPGGADRRGVQGAGRRWMPILDAFDEAGVDALLRAASRRGPARRRHLRALSRPSVGDHPRANILYDPSHMVLQQMDYLAFLDIYHERVRAFHVKDAEFNPSGRAGVYGGYQDWIDRPGRFRSLGDGQIDFTPDLQQDGAIRLSGLGGGGVGVLHQASRGGRGRGRGVYSRPHHSRHRPRLRRFCRRRGGYGTKPQNSRSVRIGVSNSSLDRTPSAEPWNFDSVRIGVLEFSDRRRNSSRSYNSILQVEKQL